MALRIREATAALNALGVRQETLQDALDLGMGGDDTQVALDAIGETVQAWKKYRVQVSQVPAQAAYPQNVAWPDAPEVTAENEAVRGKADE
ncbi:tail fiber assembly protein [Pluralibacter gergoviae]|uniref:Tail fiber assembly protein n=2 Tax=Pluralibacter gergoviae TaxID=61647 RepID=A0AAI9DG05_PLUGE|nr:tail fiber assembly protein [Pluralibacter gergoviae]EKV9907881.1 tail fiber assembly protein [Pluralibacter gergoviae]EKW7272443.1 tail fiber assembly protein [Pluralibacter gergoviae]ELD4293932.1 tail fiber assembly protein [Pluralibacter gergoviae]ELD4304711.1 tail fiber assembly protein [Pluralibacter gergoviae]